MHPAAEGGAIGQPDHTPACIDQPQQPPGHCQQHIDRTDEKQQPVRGRCQQGRGRGGVQDRSRAHGASLAVRIRPCLDSAQIRPTRRMRAITADSACSPCPAAGRTARTCQPLPYPPALRSCSGGHGPEPSKALCAAVTRLELGCCATFIAFLESCVRRHPLGLGVAALGRIAVDCRGSADPYRGLAGTLVRQVGIAVIDGGRSAGRAMRVATKPDAFELHAERVHTEQLALQGRPDSQQQLECFRGL